MRVRYAVHSVTLTALISEPCRRLPLFVSTGEYYYKLVTLVLFNNTGTLQIQVQIQGPESTVIRNELRKPLSLPVHEESGILVSEEDATIKSEHYNCHEEFHGELDY